MASPESSLRRRGRGGSVSESASNGNGNGHARAESDGFGSFVDSTSAFPSIFESGSPSNRATSSSIAISSPTRTRSTSASQPPKLSTHKHTAEDDDWAEADLVSSFSPVEPHFSSQPTPPKAVPNPGSRPPSRRKVSGTGASSEWADWSSFLAAHTLPTDPSSQASSSKTKTPAVPPNPNPADDAFFDAFEIATNPPTRFPSPPVIDLRGVEKKLEAKKQQQQAADDDFFSRFERAPETALGRKSPLVLEPEQLESMHDARTSPLATSGGRKGDSYFPQPKKEGGFSPASPSSWTGSLRKTWTTLRGIQSEIASHLPSASDFIVPAEEVEEQEAKEGAGEGGSGGLLIASEGPTSEGERRHSNTTLPHASDYSQQTPFSSHQASSTGFSAGAAAPTASTAPLRARDLFASSSSASLGGSGASSLASSGNLRRGPTHSSTAPISGAPGFDTSSTRQWNTGHWTLNEERQKRVIPVTLSNRREETDPVIEEFHASRLQALLPPRLQLGKRWSLLYSLDQHGISLQTLYHRVAAGLDPTKRSVSGALSPAGGEEGEGERAEGWLRGASRETQAALGTRTKHVGGGLSSISDAGLIIAIKDENDHIFGAFVNEKLRPQQHYYGSGECFLWKKTSSDEGGEKGIKKYRWTGKNDYMILSETTFLSVGGGEGKFGLWVDERLEKGVSGRCPAFDNEVLCDGKGDKEGEGRFTCYGLEVWAVGID